MKQTTLTKKAVGPLIFESLTEERGFIPGQSVEDGSKPNRNDLRAAAKVTREVWALINEEGPGVIC